MASSESDVLIVGAGSAGAFMGWRLASLGFNCTVLEKRRLEELGTDIGPFHMEEEAFERFGIPGPEAPELLHEFSRMTTWSPRFEHSFSFSLPTLVLDKPLFTRRMHSLAREAGADIIENAEVTGIQADGGILRGVRATVGAEEVKWRARLVVDASGIDGAVRTSMPASRWFENDPVSALDTIFVYMETWRDVTGERGEGVNSFPAFIGWSAPGPGDTTIVGVGMGGSPEAARSRHREMVERIPLAGTVAGSAGGRVPYRRPPLSLVDNRLIVVGDAAFTNKPFSGEGVTSGLAGCESAVRAASAALANDDLTRDGLWAYNVEYFRGQGAAFAMLTAVLPAMMSVSDDEMEAFFDLGLMTQEGAVALQRDYALKTRPGAALEALSGLARGLASGRIGVRSLARIARMGAAGAALKALYEHYPTSPLELGRWMKAARSLWRRADIAKHEYFQT